MEWRRSDRHLPTVFSWMESADVAEWYPVFMIQMDPTLRDLPYTVRIAAPEIQVTFKSK